jgi:hypothetical protein
VAVIKLFMFNVGSKLRMFVVNVFFSKLFTNNLVTRSAATECQEANADVGYFGYSGAEHVPCPNDTRTDVAYHPDSMYYVVLLLSEYTFAFAGLID